jgi:hypothetical protein
MLSVTYAVSLMLSVSCKPYMLNVIMLSVVMLNAVMLSVIMLSVKAPYKHRALGGQPSFSLIKLSFLHH